MKFPLHLMLTASAPLSVSGYLHPSTTTTTTTLLHHRYSRISHIRQPSQLHYKEPSSSESKSESGGSSDDSSSSSGNDASNVWSVLADTERWISDTLDRSNKSAIEARDRQDAAAELKKEQDKKKLHFADEKKKEEEEEEERSRLPRTDNPYARKEVSYVCETGMDLSVVVGGVFRRVREARELGESHGRGVESRLGDTSQPTTMRLTNVVVIPNCKDIAKYQTFDKLIQAINQARRSSRDFVLKKKEEDDSKDWCVSINCAHLHPQFGKPTPAEELAALKHEEEEGEVDVNLQEYKKRRDEARRSPYPSIIVEVQSTPPPDFGSRRDEAAMEAAAKEMEENERTDDVTSEDVKKLEALFGMSAAKKTGSVDDPFYDALGEAFGNKQIISQTPLSMAQNWVTENDPAFNKDTSAFTNSNTRHVDAAYEYVFHNLAMLTATMDDTDNEKRHKRGQKSYVVLPNFVPTSATSFDRFAGQVSNIIRVMPNLVDKVMVSTFHPEHVVASTRAPVPIVVITWK
mmetsp:Transcript_6769/g.10172  ORF Transcript_6769/g.10172 Transcript_6769/m.10172 type:complete len:518 (-) Transcript_6769:633-2186(-)